MLRQSSTSVERYRVRVDCSADPTATAPQFKLVLDGEPGATGWVAGSWEAGGWVLGSAYALTPTISGTGSGGAISSADGRWALWVKLTGTGGEVPVRRVPSVIEIF